MNSRWTILEPVAPAWGKARALARCECGTTREVIVSNIEKGKSLSCGCLRGEMLARVATTHGLSKRPEYQAWHAMLRRCEDPKNNRYYYYGARGISVCDEWHDFAKFFADMGPRPAGMSLDRIDNNGNYEPGNCRWTTQRVQVRNSRPRSHCINGHEYTPENTGRNERGNRRCLICARRRGIVS